MTEELLAFCIRDPRNELVPIECENLTGGKPDRQGAAGCLRFDLIHHAAYVHTGARRLAHGKTLNRLIEDIGRGSFEAEDFRIEFLRLSKQMPVDRREAILAVADAIEHYPNLDAPKHRFLLAVREQDFWFGEIMTESAHTYIRHDARPCHTSSSLPSRLSRALVNLVVPPARKILDPCCGTGSILLEARAVGADACGADWNPRMVGMSRKNLRYFGYAVDVERADARSLTRTADALVTNLPYGNKLEMSETDVRTILARAAACAPVAVYVAARDLSCWFRDAGYRDIEVFRVPKYTGFIRYVHRVKSPF